FVWNGNTLNFSIVADTAAVGLQAMLPYQAGTGVISGITRDGNPVTLTPTAIKGIQYAAFAAATGAYAATYVSDSTAPTVTATSPSNGANGVNVSTSVTA